MQRITSGLVVSGLLALGCGGAGGGNAAGTDSALTEQKGTEAEPGNKALEAKPEGCGPGNIDFGTGDEVIERQLKIARQAVCKYRRLEAALADGYVNTGLPCIPGQGLHYIKNSIVGTTDIRHPSVLMYTADGNLNSPEWVAPLSGFPSPPTIFGEVMHAEDELGLWIQHVWVWKLNPNGVFDDINPNVTCP